MFVEKNVTKTACSPAASVCGGARCKADLTELSGGLFRMCQTNKFTAGVCAEQESPILA